ncbi:transcription termination factor 3, mitochondrial isoform X2 [Xenopus tropicalis]|uniref:Transcription termination factor 3, mitochondrial isoform X2 n=1 Tax=Xenopus tropicalis TaxID=8364 RepID=A0A8J0R264_XENTR|nr:transcription termination factor 3, mitochondrial isoform X2 [Xenopus tropicalis]
MFLVVCRISRRCSLLNASNYAHFSRGLWHSAALTQRSQRKNEMVALRRLLGHIYGTERTTWSSVMLLRRHFTHLSTEGDATVMFSEQNLPSIKLYPQETKVLPGTDFNTLSEDLEGAPPLSPLEEITENEAAQIAADLPIPPASFTLQDYVDQSETLKKLVLLGVDLSKLEKRPNVANFLLRLDFERDVSRFLLFLKDVGLEDSQLGAFLSKNPFILSEDLENLQKRVSYLRLKEFSKEAVARMVAKAPYLLNFSIERLDNRLGFFQRELGLSTEKTRDLIIRLPRLLTGSLEPVRENLKVFNTKLLKMKERHLFLGFLGRAVYDPTKPNYVSLDKLTSTPNEIFCVEVAKASVQDYERFLKTL